MEELLVGQFELLSEVESLVARLNRWSASAPPWQPADLCRALVRRLADRADSLRLRLESPLVVATIGGTGTGKSTLVNALLGAEVVAAGRRRPTTMRPTLICRPGITAETLGIATESVEVIHRDLPLTRDLVLVDCPDPDTSEAEVSAVAPDGLSQTPPGVEGRPANNLARLHEILPHCDVLLVTGTQQKYRDARIADELALAAAGARLVFVQTRADLDADIRDDWRSSLGEEYAAGKIFRVDSLMALADAQAHRQPRGEFAELVDLLTRELAGAAQVRIRRANFLDLAAETLGRCRQRIDQGMPAVQKMQEAIDTQRAALSARLAMQMRADLLTSRRQWESRLLDQTASRWGLSPFSLVLRAWQGLGGLLSGALLWRARTPAQMALWGAAAGAKTLHAWSRRTTPDQVADRAVAGCWSDAELRSAALILDGYARDAGLSRDAVAEETVSREAVEAGRQFVGAAAGEIEALIGRIAARQTGWFSRMLYESLFVGMCGALLVRLGKNFFYDSWLAANPTPVFGLDFYASAGFWLVLWCVVLLWAFLGRLRRGLRSEIDRLSGTWTDAAAGLFRRMEKSCRDVVRFREELDSISAEVQRLRDQLARADSPLGRRR